MDLYKSTRGVAGIIPAGIEYPIVTDCMGRCNISLVHFFMNQIGANIWKSKKTWITMAERLIDILAYFEDNNISPIEPTVSDFTKYRHFKLKIGIGGKPSSAQVVDQCISAFKQYWAFGIKHGYFTDNNLIKLEDYKINGKKPAFADMHLPTGDEISRFFSTLRGIEERIGTGLTFGVGLRRSEIVGLPADIIKPVASMPRVDDAVCLYLDGNHAPTKGAVPRTVEIPVKLYSEIYNYCIGARRHTRVSRAKQPAETVLVSKYGKSYVPGWLNDVFARARALTFLTIHPHLLRHWYATRFIEYNRASRFSGSERRTYQKLQLLLGHSQLETTYRYAHVALDDATYKVRAISSMQRKLEEIFDVGF